MRITIHIWEDICSRSINRMSNVIFEFLRVSGVVTIMARNNKACISAADGE